MSTANGEMASSTIATRSRQRRTLAYGWDDDGALRLSVVVGTANGPVFGIPSTISRYVAGRRFQARTQEGTTAGVIAVNEEGTSSWGFGPFLHRRGAEVGDILSVRFNLVTGEATLTLGDEVTLDEGE
jgi:hypothetical protein